MVVRGVVYGCKGGYMVVKGGCMVVRRGVWLLAEGVGLCVVRGVWL